PSGGYEYGPYHDGPDPLAPPVELREAMDEIGGDVMEGASPRSALEELLRRGTPRAAGLDEPTRRVGQRRAEIQRNHRLAGTLQDGRRLLEAAWAAEREAPAADPSAGARSGETRLAALPPGTAGPVTERAEYEWRSPPGRENYERIRAL